MTYIIRSLFTVALLVLIDYYAFQAWKTFTRNHEQYRLVFWVVSGLAYAMLIASLILVLNGTRNAHVFHYTMTIMLVLYVPKIFVCFWMFGEDIWRFFEGAWMSLSGQREAGESFIKGRRRFVSQLALGTAALPFLSILYGVWKGKYRFQVIEKTLEFDDLPEAFDGFVVAQISDLHTGSFDSKDDVLRGLNLINQANPDVVLFTGDLVNNEAKEMHGWESVYRTVKAKVGKFSVLGNHDYGDYVPWGSAEEKRANFQSVVDAHEAMDFQLLRNEAVELKRGNDALYIAGVENWGKPPFPQYGDLDAAIERIPKEGFTLLMSHDPSHFDEQIKHHNKHIHVTYSGHTHGMQFGVEIPGWIKWSPVKFRYAKWAGLYTENNRHLYVNRGFGHIGFLGRVGIWPEITVMTLKRKSTSA